MLDDLKMIHQRDGQDMLGVAEKQWQQLTYQFAAPETYASGLIGNIVYCGLGGSVQVANMARALLDIARPFEIVVGYELPIYVSANTLCIISISKDTELQAREFITQAKAKESRVVLMVDATVAESFTSDSLPVIVVPHHAIAELTQWYAFNALLCVLASSQLTTYSSQALFEQSEWLQRQLAGWRPDVPTAANEAKRIALELMGKSVVIYSGPQLGAAAWRWKSSINMLAKQVAWCGQYPAVAYDEFAGWSKQPVHKPYAIIDIRSDLDDARIQRQFREAEKALSGRRPSPTIVVPVGNTVLQQLLYSACLGDFVAIYLALLGGINPAPAKVINSTH